MKNDEYMQEKIGIAHAEINYLNVQINQLTLDKIRTQQVLKKLKQLRSKFLKMRRQK